MNAPIWQMLRIVRRKFSVWLILGILVLTAAILAELYLLTGPPIDIHSKAALGDTINGLTAPLIGIVGALLIYISLKEQVKSNKFHFQALHEQREWDLLYRLYEELKEDLKNLQKDYGSKHPETDILEQFMSKVIADTYDSSPYPGLSKYLDYIFKQFSFLSLRISQNSVLGNSEKVHLIEKNRLLFNLYFEPYYARIVNEDFKSRFSVSFNQNIQTAGRAIIKLNSLSIDILKEKYLSRPRG
jgi:hypothetical protein